MMRRTIAVLAGLLLLGGLAMLPSSAGAQSPPEFTVPPTVLPSSTVPPQRPTTTRPSPSSTRPPARPPTTVAVEPDNVENTTTRPRDTRPQVQGDVVSRPLPRTGSELNGTALFGAALTVGGVGLALAARKRRNSYEGS